MKRLLLAVVTGLGAVSAGCGGQTADPIADAIQRADSADQLMIGLKQNMTNEGVRQAYLEADTAFIYETRSFIDLINVRVTFFTSTGEQTSVLTARAGKYNMRNSVMEAMGDVRVVRTDGGRLATSHLVFEQNKNEVRTDSAYTYTTADREVQGDGFISDPSFQNIVSRNLRGRAGGFTLPNQ